MEKSKEEAKRAAATQPGGAGSSGSSAAKVEESMPADAMDKARTVCEFLPHISIPMALEGLRRVQWDLDRAAEYIFSNEDDLLAFEKESQSTLAAGSGGGGGQGGGGDGMRKSGAAGQGMSQEDVKRIFESQSQYYSVLFQVFEMHRPELSRSVWDLLMMLPTSPTMQYQTSTLRFSQGMDAEEVLRVSKEHEEVDVASGDIQWDMLFDLHNPFRLLYSLQIVDGLLFPVREEEEEEDTALRTKWCQSFLDNGGFLHLYNILIMFASSSSLDTSASADQFQTSVYEEARALIIKLFGFFLLAVISKNDSASSGSSSTPLRGSDNLPRKNEREKQSDSHEKQDASNVLDTGSTDLGVILRYLVSRESSERITCQIDFPVLLRTLLGIVHSLGSLSSADRSHAEVVSHAMTLITRCVSWNPDELLGVFYGTANVEETIRVCLCTSPESNIRRVMGDSLWTMCTTVHHVSDSLATIISPPHNYFLTLLLDALPDAMTTNTTTCNRWEEFFAVLCRLLSAECVRFKASIEERYGKGSGEKYSSLQDAGEEYIPCVDLEHFLIESVKKVVNRPIVETRFSDVEDHVLIGYMDVARVLLHSLAPPLRRRCNILSFEDSGALPDHLRSASLIKILHSHFLFTLKAISG